MTTPDERDMQAHEATHPGCNERYWRERETKAKAAARHFLYCQECRGGPLCEEGKRHAREMGFI
jgi:hypothetical protein